MIPFEEAFDIAIQSAPRLDSEQVDLQDAHFRILAQELHADMAMPPFDKTMVDGYACRRAELPNTLTVVETIAAGYPPEKALGPNEAAKIMTGAEIPQGADCVFMVEHSESSDSTVRFTGERTNDNIAPMGRDIQAGDLLLSPGHRLMAPDIGVLASMGCTRPTVFIQPRVGIIGTGDELVDAGTKPSPSQIRNSNGPQLCAQVQAMGCPATYVGTARDTEESIEACLQQAAAKNDVILLSGGVSMGEFDLVPAAMERNGIKIQFDRVAIQPGKPTTFAKSDSTYCFGLPGNPVSTFVIFELLVKPFLFAMMGHTYRPPSVRLPLAKTMTRKAAARKAWVPVTTTPEGQLERIDYHSSAHLNAFCHAEGIIAFPEGLNELTAGTEVDVHLVRN